MKRGKLSYKNINRYNRKLKDKLIKIEKKEKKLFLLEEKKNLRRREYLKNKKIKYRKKSGE